MLVKMHVEYSGQFLPNTSRNIDNSKRDSPNVPNFDSVVFSQCPVRIDIAGGWSDTPPICYQTSGAVCISSELDATKRSLRSY